MSHTDRIYRHSTYRQFWVYLWGPHLHVTDDYGNLVRIPYDCWYGVLQP